MKTQVPLAGYTTLRVGGPADKFVEVETEPELIAAVRDADAAGEPVLLLSGGSNVVIGDDGFRGTVVKVATSGIRVDADACSGATVHVAAGEDWDAVVQRAIAEEWSGLESMSGIPGLAGSTPVQNVGAYGHEVAGTIASVRVWDRTENAIRTIFAADCGFSYRNSRFKADPDRYVVLEVAFHLRLGDLSAPVEYAELARVLDVEPGSRAPMTEVREAVLGLRRGKGMVLDPADHDTWSAGSFFTNPILDTPAEVPAGAPQWPLPDGRVKTSAAWLIEHAGVSKGFTIGAAAVSTKHTLALTNRGQATTKELLTLATHVRSQVHQAFNITLVNEPVLVNCTL
ncbi:UDP-N-acetylmuramate dehydrogenase [Kribbella solani]|uniref:UDP-N-acetylmuramate dehydrogenase n=1 Tax=Kribbella solani TaxID=236067 RepID=UPI0029AFA143|nr:UDP-N-acetylmuramate dehydrogenase [Kribbella solani]MDX2973653.1 UDP-N-acetylmuramate dehydrogenase [Kribbella solani]MDX3000866.1 UDP-N-acetylmuramate dehydrogenase [Kribbella solani]